MSWFPEAERGSQRMAKWGHSEEAILRVLREEVCGAGPERVARAVGL
jgi:hypothetical protein